MRNILNGYTGIFKTIYNNKFATFIAVIWLCMLSVLNLFAFTDESTSPWLIVALNAIRVFVSFFGFLVVFRLYQDKEPGISSFTALFNIKAVYVVMIASVLFIASFWSQTKIIPEVFDIKDAATAFYAISYQASSGEISAENALIMLDNNQAIHNYLDTIANISIASYISAGLFALACAVLILFSLAFAFAYLVRNDTDSALKAMFMSIEKSLSTKSVMFFVIIPLIALWVFALPILGFNALVSLLIIVALHNQVK